MRYEHAPDIQQRVLKIARVLRMDYVNPARVICIRSYGSTARALARIWAFPKIFQVALNFKPYYIIEVISHLFDRLDEVEQDKTLIHELLHVPKTFSGGLVPHAYFDKRIDRKTVEELYRRYISQIHAESG
ncbi:hypothetical protein A3K63_04240 [Candidatus Micrarchaeota archaeon RBG_16_49_10]|nr:MAG: hypothetical protein A3K63_04240 [Candidatus Micrarchaeota archaeon RBG_16_49_10]